MVSTAQQLRGLVLNAIELKELNGWKDEMVEDYLNIINNLITLADEIDTKSDLLHTTTRVSTSPFTPQSTDMELFVDTDSGDIDITLPPGVDGTSYRIINVGSSGNRVYMIPALTDNLFGENESEYLADGEAAIITFETTEGWQ